jgi:hypothetical protein
MIEFKTDTPTKSALYLVDRGMQGKAYRYYNADTGKWGMCGYDFNEALEGKDNFNTFETVGVFPWAGPLTGPNLKLDRPVHMVQIEEPESTKPKKQSKRLAKQTGSKLVDSNTKVVTKSNTKVLKSTKSSSTKVVHPDGTVFYRADRQKWVAVMNGKQEAARPTSDACLAFLKKKYNVTGTVLNKE